MFKTSPIDLSITEVAMLVGLSDRTTAMYIKVLEAKGRVEFSRAVGNTKLYRLKK